MGPWEIFFVALAALWQAYPTQWCFQEGVKLVPPGGLKGKWGLLYIFKHKPLYAQGLLSL